MDSALVLAGLAMGAAASPHCAAMCGAPCAALSKGCARSSSGFHVGRLIGYSAGGALAAASVAALGVWSQAAPALRPLWALLHLALLALGLWWLASGRPPDWVRRQAAVAGAVAMDGPAPLRRIDRRHRTLRASLAGLAWVAWPCAALQSALLLAALASSAAAGALVMAAYAVGSMPGLAFAPWVWSRWRMLTGRDATSAAGSATATTTAIGFRIAGLSLAVTSGWALTHGLWERVAAWCAA